MKTKDLIRSVIISVLVLSHHFQIMLIRNNDKSRFTCLIDNLHTGMRFHLALMPLNIDSYG